MAQARLARLEAVFHAPGEDELGGGMAMDEGTEHADDDPDAFADADGDTGS